MALDLLAQFDNLLPLATEWVKAQEALILQKGAPLTVDQLIDAHQAGVSFPRQIRVLSVPVMPLPEHPALREACRQMHFLEAQTAGLTLRYGICIRADCQGNRRLLVHECVHVAQYERFDGDIAAFLGEYLRQVLTIGYPAAPLEQEAVVAAKNF